MFQVWAIATWVPAFLKVNTSATPSIVPEWQQSKKAFNRNDYQRLRYRWCRKMNCTFSDDPGCSLSTSLARSSYRGYISSNISAKRSLYPQQLTLSLILFPSDAMMTEWTGVESGVVGAYDNMTTYIHLFHLPRSNRPRHSPAAFRARRLIYFRRN